MLTLTLHQLTDSKHQDKPGGHYYYYLHLQRGNRGLERRGACPGPLLLLMLSSLLQEALILETEMVVGLTQPVTRDLVLGRNATATFA